MAIESKNHRATQVEVLSSQASKRDARPAGAVGVEDPETEYQRLIVRKRDLEQTLSTSFSKAAYTQRQFAIRGKAANGGNETTLNEWLRERAALDAEKNRLKAERNAIENRLMELKPLLQRLKSLDVEKRDGSFSQQFDAMRAELRVQTALMTRIAELLSQLVANTAGGN